MFKRKAAKQDAEPAVLPPRDPYSAAKAEFNDIHGAPIIQARNWRFLALLATSIALIAVIALAVRANQSRFVPYIVEVDKFGSVAATGLADKANVQDERIIRAFLHRFITDARRVTFDPGMQKEAVNRVFTMLASNTAAQAKMSETFATNNPFARGQSEAVSAEISSILRISDKSWQVAWVETTRDQQGQVRNQAQWKATLTVAFNAPTEEQQILMNPLGLFITDFDWRQELSQ